MVLPDAEKNNVSFDPNSGKFRWKVNSLPAFTGKFSEARKIIFQLDVVPDNSDKGKNMTFMTKVQAIGTDTFIEEPVQSALVQEITSATLEDDQLDAKGSEVK